MSKGTKTSNEPWKEAKPYMLGGANTLNNVYNANAGNIQNAADSVGALLPDAISAYKAGTPHLTAAQNYNTDVLSGKYLGQGNPYLNDLIASSGNDVKNQVQASMGARGLVGGSDYANSIANQVSKNSLGLRYQDYANERGNMANAAGQAGMLVGAEANRLAPVNSIMSSYMMPLDAASQYAGSLGGLLGGYQTQSSKKSTGSSIADGLATAAQIASLFMGSDERLKTDIKPVGKTFAGQTIYTYRYKAGGPTQMGVMAQESPKEALGPLIDGFMSVNYGEIR